MIVVSDTSPLRYLILIGQAGLLEKLYGCVACPERVVSECRHPSAPAGVRDFMDAPPSWLVIYPDPPIPEDLIDVLDPGEAAAIALAEQLLDSVLLMDERKGRRLAEARGLQVAGTLNVLAQSGAAGLIDFHAIIAHLRRETNFRVSDAIVEKAWTAAQS